MIDKYLIPVVIGVSFLVLLASIAYALHFYWTCPNQVVTTPFGLACVRR